MSARLITDAMEAAFATRIQAGQASDVVLDVWKLLAESIERVVDEHADKGLDRIDLQQEAQIALTTAVHAFAWSSDRGFEAAALAHVAKHLTAALAFANRPLLIPAEFCEMAEKVIDASRELVQQLGRAATATEIAAHIGCSADEMRSALSAETEEFTAPPFGPRGQPT